MCYREMVSAFLWSIIVFLIPNLSMHKRNKDFQHFIWADLKISSEGFVTTCCPRTPEWIYPHTTRELRSQKTGNKNVGTKGNDLAIPTSQEPSSSFGLLLLSELGFEFVPPVPSPKKLFTSNKLR